MNHLGPSGQYDRSADIHRDLRDHGHRSAAPTGGLGEPGPDAQPSPVAARCAPGAADRRPRPVGDRPGRRWVVRSSPTPSNRPLPRWRTRSRPPIPRLRPTRPTRPAGPTPTPAVTATPTAAPTASPTPTRARSPPTPTRPHRPRRRPPRPPPLSDTLRLVRLAVIRGSISPKSVVATQTGLFFAQNMMYRHTMTVYNRKGTLREDDLGQGDAVALRLPALATAGATARRSRPRSRQTAGTSTCRSTRCTARALPTRAGTRAG